MIKPIAKVIPNSKTVRHNREEEQARKTETTEYIKQRTNTVVLKEFMCRLSASAT